MSTNNYDIVFITETWLHSEISDSLISPSNYNLFRCDRKTRGGGIVLLASKTFPFLPVQSQSTKYYEILCLDFIVSLASKIRLILIYFPPKFTNNVKAIETLCDELFNLCAVDYHLAPLIINFG